MTEWERLRDWVISNPLAATNEITALRRPTYAVVEIGCIECGDDTIFSGTTREEPPADIPILNSGAAIRISYHSPVIALKVQP